MDLDFVPLTLAELAMLQRWHEDEELTRWIQAPTPRWFEYVTTDPLANARIVYEDEEPVGYVQWDLQSDGTAACSIVVRPDIRGRGYGQRILRALLALPEVARIPTVWGTIEPENLASTRCFEAVGFVIEPYPEDPDFVKAVYHRPN